MSKFHESLDFIRGVFATDEFISLHEPRFVGKEIEYLTDTIKSTFVSSVGLYVDRFENMLSDLTQTRKSVAVVNGTSALQVALRLSGVKYGDEVITQSLTFVATVNAIAYNGGQPIFLDVDLDTMGLSPRAVAAFLAEFGELREDGCYNKSTGKKISACLPMHTFGFPVHIDELQNVCNNWKIPMIEDAAEALGSFYKGRHVGGFGQMGAFSFNGNKIITSGGGGAIITNDMFLADQARYLTTTAKQPHPYEFFHDQLGYNFRMPNLNAALACAQLEQLGFFLENKRKLANKYEAFFESKGIRFRTELPDTKANYWLMCVELEDRKDRDLFIRETNNSRIMTRPIWQLMYRLPMYSHCQKDTQANSEQLESTIVNIPSSVRIEI